MKIEGREKNYRKKKNEQGISVTCEATTSKLIYV